MQTHSCGKDSVKLGYKLIFLKGRFGNRGRYLKLVDFNIIICLMMFFKVNKKIKMKMNENLFNSPPIIKKK